MCTMCNSGYTASCNSTLTQANVLNCNSCLGYGQRICRDCCGNVWVRRTTNCGCCQNTPCCQQNTCSNDNGFGFFTVFGRIVSGYGTNGTTATNGTANGTNTTNYDNYYARQYGYSRCGCCGSNSTND